MPKPKKAISKTERILTIYHMFRFDNKWEDKYKSLQYGYIVMKNIGGNKRYSAINHDGRIMVEDIPGFAQPEFPKQYVFHDEEKDEDEE